MFRQVVVRHEQEIQVIEFCWWCLDWSEILFTRNEKNYSKEFHIGLVKSNSFLICVVCVSVVTASVLLDKAMLALINDYSRYQNEVHMYMDIWTQCKFFEWTEI